MYAIIKGNQIIWFTDKKITEDNMLFDKLIDWNFDTSKNYIFENWKIIENLENIKNEKINNIKQKYQNMIFQKYSLTDQLNMSNEAFQITALAQFEKRDFTEEETLKLLEIQEAKKWIDQKRKECQDEIQNLSVNP